MAMPFTAPGPWEADAFYAQPGMNEAGLSLNQWPVGSGPYMMKEFVRDRRHVMVRNPNYRDDLYPCEGMPGDREAGLLDDCGKRMPFIDTLYVTIEKEKVARKEKFKQGYLDVPEIERPEWGVDFRNDADDSDAVAALFKARGFQFPLMTDISNWYLGFNMLDPVVGQGATPEQAEKNRKLRQALAIVIDYEEGYGRIFKHKGGVAAHSPLPPGLFGSREGELVELSGRLDIYGPRGDLQLIVESMTRQGQGNLFEQFMRLKAALEAEGLFDAARKRQLPAVPRTIGLVTSLGLGAEQATAGLHVLFGLPADTTTKVVLIAVITLIAVGAVPSVGDMDVLTDRIGALDGVERTTSSIVLSTKFER